MGEPSHSLQDLLLVRDSNPIKEVNLEAGRERKEKGKYFPSQDGVVSMSLKYLLLQRTSEKGKALKHL